jgi:hypothetical protein
MWANDHAPERPDIHAINRRTSRCDEPVRRSSAGPSIEGARGMPAATASDMTPGSKI